MCECLCASTSSDNVIAGVTSTYNHTGRTNGTTYYYRMVAKNAGGDVSSLSSEDSGTPNAPPTISLNSTSGFLVSSGSNPYTLEIYEGQAAVITFNIADADGGDSPYAYCASLPSWASIGGHPDTTMDITPDLGDSATGSFTCQASDGKDTSSTTLTFNYTVKVPVIASSDSVASTQTSTTAYDEAMGRAAASNNGHRLVIYPEVAHAGLLYCRWDGSDWDDCGELTDTNRYIYDTSNNTTKHFNIAAGDDGNFVVCWVDTATTGTTTGTDAKLKVKRFLSGSWEGFIVPTYQLLIFL